jgi:hypothetical protein
LFHAQNAGAVALLVATDEYWPFPMTAIPEDESTASLLSIPAVMMGNEAGLLISEGLVGMSMDGSVLILQGPATLPAAFASADNLAPFSSQGPTPDMRFKPDIVAVGEIFSGTKCLGCGLRGCHVCKSACSSE